MNLLEELRAQRELIQRHLAWLDRKIAALESEEPKKTAPASDEGSKAPKIPQKDAEETTQVNEPLVAQTEEAEIDENFGSYKAPKGDEIQRAKIGCLILFILGTLLFLFLLFGLPYLMD